MSLQDQLLADFGETLLDPDGPAQIATVAGREMRVVIDEPGIASADPRTGLMLGRMDLYLRRDDLGFSPVSGTELIINGTSWTVETPSPHGMGVIKLGLLRYLA